MSKKRQVLPIMTFKEVLKNRYPEQALVVDYIYEHMQKYPEAEVKRYTQLDVYDKQPEAKIVHYALSKEFNDFSERYHRYYYRDDAFYALFVLKSLTKDFATACINLKQNQCEPNPDVAMQKIVQNTQVQLREDAKKIQDLVTWIRSFDCYQNAQRSSNNLFKAMLSFEGLGIGLLILGGIFFICTPFVVALTVLAVGATTALLVAPFTFFTSHARKDICEPALALVEKGLAACIDAQQQEVIAAEQCSTRYDDVEEYVLPVL